MKAKSIFILSLLFISILGLQGCKWRDDFRSRVHPQYQEERPEATFNEDSDYYVGDEVAKGTREDGPEMDAIDELSDIPELPDSPQQMN